MFDDNLFVANLSTCGLFFSIAPKGIGIASAFRA
jgi:hypothetical protein